MKKLKFLVAAELIACTSIGGYIVAAEDVYELNPVVVTGERTEKKDLEIPAAVQVITAKEIKEQGYTSVADALGHTVDVGAYSYTSDGDDLGGSQSRFYIRGFDKGTSVLVNGAPINIMNYSSTSGVPIDAVEKIEVIKGPSSVLYGAEAMGGVVNIITKKGGEDKTTAKVTYGNYTNGYQVSTSGEKYFISFNRDNFDRFNNPSTIFPKSKYGWENDKGHRTNLFTSINLTDKLTFDWMRFSSNKNRWAKEVKDGKKTGKIYTGTTGLYNYNDVKNTMDLIYNDEESHFKSIMAFNNRRLDSTNTKFNKDGSVKSKARGTNYNVYNFNFNNQKTWYLNDGKDSLTAGLDYKYEHYKSLNGEDHIGRSNYGLFASYSHEFNDRMTGIFGAREFVNQSNGWDKSNKKFLPQVQFLYKLSDDWSLYTNVGESFDMPAINSKYYSSKLKNWNIKPQSGWTYEFGTKYITGKDSLKIDVFHMDIKDKFEWVHESELIDGGADNINVQVNGGDFKNTGLEVEYEHIINSNWRYSLGASISNPKMKDYNSDVWRQSEARLQGSASLSYEEGKFYGGLNYFLISDRQDSHYTRDGSIAKNTKGWDHKTPNSSLLNAVFSYAPNKEQAVTLNLYNLLDRKNPINDSENVDLPFHWTVSYSYSF